MHPIHVDAVTWVSASSEVLFTLFAVASLLLLLGKEPGDPPRLWLSAALFCAAAFSKETAIALLPILVGVAWVQLAAGDDGPVRRLWRATLPYLAASTVYVAARGVAMDRVRLGNAELSWGEVVYSSPSTLLFYLKKLVVPIGLSPSYVHTVTTAPTARFWFELLAVLVGFGLAGWIALKNRSLAGLGIVWIVLPIVPALAVLRLYPASDRTPDRYLYASSVGLSILAAVVVGRLWPRGGQTRRITLGLGAAVVSIFAGLTFAQQKYYQDDFAYYNRAIQVNSANAAAYSALGDLYLDQGDTKLALENHSKAHALAPNDARLTLLLARALFQAKKYSEAETTLNSLLQDPGLSMTHRVSAVLSLANVEIELNKLDAAQALLEQVERVAPDTPELHWAKGILFQREGLLVQAQAEYEKEYGVTGDSAAQRQAMILAQKNARSTASQSGGTSRPQPAVP
jgi:tetratricopeptide (TPR) repeat protein